MKSILGIDPGLSGAVALYDPNTGELEVHDVPVHQIGSKRTIDHYGFARIIDNWSTVNPVVWLEFVASSPQMGVSSAFKFGDTNGVIRGVCAAHFLSIITVTPAAWKRAMKVTGDKDECRAKACALFPKHTFLFARKKDDGRAEAALIAMHGSLAPQAAAA